MSIGFPEVCLKRAVKSPGGPIRWTLEGWMHRGLVWRFGFDWLLLSDDFLVLAPFPDARWC